MIAASAPASEKLRGALGLPTGADYGRSRDTSVTVPGTVT